MMTFEDFSCGRAIPLGEYRLGEDEIMEFARRYDPQYFHTDPEAAAHSVFGGLIASGWLTTAIFMRLQCDAFMIDSSCIGSPGVDEIRWLHPVRPGDVLRGHLEVISATPSRSKPDRGSVISRGELYNQHDTKVMSLITRAIFLTAAGAACEQEPVST